MCKCRLSYVYVLMILTLIPRFQNQSFLWLRLTVEATLKMGTVLQTLQKGKENPVFHDLSFIETL